MNKRQPLSKLVKNIESTIKNNLLPFVKRMDTGSGGFCVLSSRIAYQTLVNEGYEPVIKFGGAAFGVNKGKFGILNFMIVHQNQEMFGNGAIEGHYWLECNGLTLDFLVPHLDFLAEVIDRQSPDKTGPIKLAKSAIVQKSKIVKSFDQIYNGKIGIYYDKKRTASEKELFNPLIDELFETINL